MTKEKYIRRSAMTKRLKSTDSDKQGDDYLNAKAGVLKVVPQYPRGYCD